MVDPQKIGLPPNFWNLILGAVTVTLFRKRVIADVIKLKILG